MLYFLIFLVIFTGDQALKWYVASSFQLYEKAPLIPGVVELQYVQNTGGGWSILSGHTWLLSLLTAIIMAVVLLLMILRVRHPMGLTACSLLLAGGIGNLVDRLRLGYVVDMFHFPFWPSYPVFNVADIAVVTGMILAAAYYLFLYDKHDAPRKKEHAHEPDHPADGE